MVHIVQAMDQISDGKESGRMGSNRASGAWFARGVWDSNLSSLKGEKASPKSDSRMFASLWLHLSLWRARRTAARGRRLEREGLHLLVSTTVPDSY